jgi:hypothetical protein
LGDVLGGGDKVAGLDGRRRGHVAEVVKRSHVAQVHSEAELHAGIVPVAPARVEVDQSGHVRLTGPAVSAQVTYRFRVCRGVCPSRFAAAFAAFAFRAVMRNRLNDAVWNGPAWFRTPLLIGPLPGG